MRWASGPGVRDGIEDLHARGAAVRQREAGLLADLLAADRGTKRGLRRVDVDRRAALFSRGEQERDLLVVASKPDSHRHAWANDAVRAGRLTDLGVLQNVL